MTLTLRDMQSTITQRQCADALDYLVALGYIIIIILHYYYYHAFLRCQLRAHFSVDDYSHYLFTPRDLTKWAMSLLRYDLTAGAKEHTSETVLEIWAYEARRLFRDRIVGTDGQAKFDKLLMSVVRSDWSANIFDEVDCECSN